MIDDYTLTLAFNLTEAYSSFLPRVSVPRMLKPVLRGEIRKSRPRLRSGPREGCRKNPGEPGHHRKELQGRGKRVPLCGKWA